MRTRPIPKSAATSIRFASVLKAASCTLLLSLVLAGPDVRCAESSPFDYRPVKQVELDRVRTEWANRDLRAREIDVFHEEKKDGFKLLLLRHEVLGRRHYGAIFLPEADDLANVPVVVLPDGLDQGNPAYDIEVEIAKYQTYEPLDALREFIQIMPAFRGRAMQYNGNSWFSRGDFCDAYDGPADDSIAMLNVSEKLFPEANFDKVLVWGGSRGANTALLMAVRDPRINTVIAAGGPVDFYRASWQVKGSDQYWCQFFDGKNEQESRDRMIASSPLFFQVHENLEDVFLHYDAEDEVVPVWNAHEIAAHLEGSAANVRTHVYPGKGHGALLGEESFWNNMKADIAAFLNRN